MTYNSDDLNDLTNLWQEVETQDMELQFSTPEGPQSPQDAVPLPISSMARQKAARMAELSHNAGRSEVFRRNLLATLVVHDYLELQGYLPDLKASDCWNPILGRMGEFADLVVSQVGRFECCAMEPKQSVYSVPEDAQFGRTGYIAVEMDSEERWGWVLGFVPGGDEINGTESIRREALQSMDVFGDYIHRLWLLWTILQERAEPWDAELRGSMVALLERTYRTRSAAQRPMRAATEITELWGEEVAGVEPRELAGTTSREGDSSTRPKLRQFLRAVFDELEDNLAEEQGQEQAAVTILRQWLNEQVEAIHSRANELMPAIREIGNQVKEGWQNLEELFSAEELAPILNMRSGEESVLEPNMRSGIIQRGKLVRLATQVSQQTIVLVLRLKPQPKNEINIVLEVRPESGQIYLPEALKVKVLDDRQKTVLEATASSSNQNIQFDFNVLAGERFSIEMIWEGTSVTEEFIV